MASDPKKPSVSFESYSAYPHQFEPEIPKHFSMVSAQHDANHNEESHKTLGSHLHEAGFRPVPTEGNYGYNEKSYLVEHSGSKEDRKKIEEIGWKHGQHSVLHSSEGKHELVFQDKSPPWTGEGSIHGPFLDQYYTQLPSGHKIRLNVKEPTAEEVAKSDRAKPSEVYDFHYKRGMKRLKKPHYYGFIDGVHDFHAQHEDHDESMGVHAHDIDDKSLPQELERAKQTPSLSLILHGNPPPSLRESAPAAAHPHAYDWHDGHTDHYEDLEKTEKPGNEQAAGKGASTYRPIAEKWGQVNPAKKTNLEYYRGIEKYEPQIDALIQKHGYQTYLAGGRHGRPDLKNKNYNTKHLMIWDPSPGSGGDFQNEAFTRSWRKVHEAAHAFTYDDVNKLYGEGRRLGKLGVRSPREAKRAVHWEWLAGHKQRELAEQMGMKISDLDFNREMNTIMHDAVHRAVTGKFAEPSDEGFQPHAHLMPLEHAFKAIDDHAKELGLTHSEATSHPKVSASPYVESKPEGSLTKAFLQHDGETKTDPQANIQATAALPSWMMEWGKRNLVPMAKDFPQTLEFSGALIKLRKVLEDLYSGWIEKEGKIIHSFDRLSMPELLQQIQSKLELYGVEDNEGNKVAEKKIEIPAKELIEEHEKLIDVLLSPSHKDDLIEAKKQAQELKGYKEEALSAPEKSKESIEDEKQEIRHLNDIDQKLQELRVKIDRFRRHEIKEHVESIAGKELVAGIENPEKECPACERPVEQCICYMNLSKPRVEFDLDRKRMYIFFKNEWGEDDRQNFRDDLMRRAGKILETKRLSRARETLSTIQKRMKK